MLPRSESSEAERLLAQSEAVLGSIADAFFLLDRDYRFTFVNSAAPPLLKSTREELLGRTLWDAFVDAVNSPFSSAYHEALTTGRPTEVESFYAPLDTWFDVHAYPWTGGLMVHFRNIGARKAAERERERLLADAEAARAETEIAHERAEEANRAKAEFLTVMSHELRTPLNAIGGHAELIEIGIHGPVTAEQRTALDRIQRSQRYLLGLINGVLNYAKIDAGAVSYHLADVPIDEVLATCEALTAPEMRSNRLDFQYDGCDVRRTVRADREKLLQVVLNLLSNAIKFTDANGSVALECAAPSDGMVMVRVSDTGRGIEADQLERVFQPFVQVDAKLTRTREGTGLGLVISRELARGMGGDLTVESEPGVGSTFTLAIPAA